jgi:hypothetical protein
LGDGTLASTEWQALRFWFVPTIVAVIRRSILAMFGIGLAVASCLGLGVAASSSGASTAKLGSTTGSCAGPVQLKTGTSIGGQGNHELATATFKSGVSRQQAVSYTEFTFDLATERCIGHAEVESFPHREVLLVFSSSQQERFRPTIDRVLQSSHLFASIKR